MTDRPVFPDTAIPSLTPHKLCELRAEVPGTRLGLYERAGEQEYVMAYQDPTSHIVTAYSANGRKCFSPRGWRALVIEEELTRVHLTGRDRKQLRRAESDPPVDREKRMRTAVDHIQDWKRSVLAPGGPADA